MQGSTLSMTYPYSSTGKLDEDIFFKCSSKEASTNKVMVLIDKATLDVWSALKKRT